MTKEDIISLINIKDYNNVLEGILETKDFSEDVKNLLLSMLYKIENAYEDYEIVKVDTQTRRQYIKGLLNIINDCQEIILAKPNSQEDKMLKKENVTYKVDEESRKIIVYQNEEIMLKALQEIAPKQIVIKEKYELYEKVIKELLSKGYVYNNTEVIRDFNGWSWDINAKAIEDVSYNLIYQNMLMLFGYEFMYCLINNCKEEEEEIPNNEILRSKYSQIASFEEDKQIDYIQEMENVLKEKYGEEIKEKIIQSFKKLVLIIISNKYKNEREKIKNIKEENEKLLEQMKNKEKFVIEITNRKKEISKRIKEIDSIINDAKLLNKEYKEINKKLANKEKIFSASQYANNLMIKRKEYLEEINNINKIMEPKEFIKVKEERENKKKFLNEWNTENNKIDEVPFMIDLQIKFLDALKKEIENAESKSKIIETIYKLRYYQFLPYKNKNISDIKEINKKIEEVQKCLIKSACDKKVLTRLSEDSELNYEILKNIFKTKIVNLENIIIILKYNKDILSTEIYDGNIIENTAEIKIDKKTELSIKLKKKIKIFGK